MRILVIGGSGHIGTFLIPRLVRGGHEVINISRGSRVPYSDSPEWQQVQQVAADREQEDRDGTFAERVAGLNADVVIDLVCFTLDSANKLVDGIRGKVQHLINCGSIWRAGVSHVLPITEANHSAPFGEYGIEKQAIVEMLKEENSRGELTTTSLHPGHISGPGWIPIGPTGNLDKNVWAALSSGAALPVPGLGAESMAHVHADDVAQAFELAVENRAAAAGEDFFVTAADALTVRGYATLGASWFGLEPQLEHVSWEAFRAPLSERDADLSWQHLVRSHAFSIEKANRLLGYSPQYTAGETVLDSVRWLIDNGEVSVDRPLTV
ncbi:NAD-dependent epimerase/dehydratase family protein [Curtobacterium sp. NPDC089689]|uniref:NAD-dependent epimerase/dehydratase family protein n=1 Tax=Curtobacterium sp. NPDC089689 TaxID=3363968 RepID=UPI0038108509